MTVNLMIENLVKFKKFLENKISKTLLQNAIKNLLKKLKFSENKNYFNAFFSLMKMYMAIPVSTHYRSSFHSHSSISTIVLPLWGFFFFPLSFAFYVKIIFYLREMALGGAKA